MKSKSQKGNNLLFPIFLKLDQISTLIIGGGNVGIEKLSAILANAPKAIVKIVAPEMRAEIYTLAQQEGARVEIIPRRFEWSDLENVQLVICATDQPQLHAEIVHEAHKRNILVNVADTPALCDFYLSSVVQKGALKIAISTNGQSPTFAKRLKELLMESLPEGDINELLENLNEVRERMKGDFASKVQAMNELTQSLLSKNDQDTR